MRRTRTILILIVTIFFSLSVFAGTPDWLRNIAQQPQKKYADDVNAVVLLDEQEINVRDAGDIVIHRRIATRILRPEGRDAAEFGIPFDKDTKVSYLRGWSITAKGQEYETKDKDSFEVGLSTFEVFADDKAKVTKIPGADVGTVVGFEYERKERPYLFQDFWWFQRLIPVERARYTLRLPARWEYRANWINHQEQNPAEEGGAYVWEVRDVPRIEREYREPPYRALAGAMIVTFYSEAIRGQTYRSWNDLGLWYSQISTGARDASPALQQKVRELAPASMPMFERIKALARFAQRDVRYAAIEVGIGGFRPHSAAEIFDHRYGDCKDKANVLASMLGQIGVNAFYMPIHNERGIYTEKTPPNRGFNHWILAIQLPDGSYSRPLPALYEHAKLGHLLIFDPTDDVVPLGQLPYYEQDSFALLVTGEGGELIHLPVSSPETNTLNRTARVTLQPDGSLQGEVEETYSGYRAALARAYWKDATEKDRKKVLERILGASLGSFQVENIAFENPDDLEKNLIVRYKFTADRYAKNAGPLLLVRPRVVGEFAGSLDNSKPRHYAYEMRAPNWTTETVEITLPEGYKVDELPASAKSSVSFAEYTSKTEEAGNVLRYTRDYKMRTTLVPVDNIDQLKRLFGDINMDEKSMAVLKKAN